MTTLSGLRRIYEPTPPRPWRAQARPEQLPPDDDNWHIWLMLAGRAWGKTRTGAEWILEQAMAHPDTEWAIVAKTIGSARDVCVENKLSGLLKCALPGEVVRYVANPCQIDLVNHARIYAFGSEDAGRIRGYNFAGAWCDELATWPYEATWDEGLVLAVRDPRVVPHIVVTTTPQKKALIKKLLNDSEQPNSSVHVVRGTTMDNAANLAPTSLAYFKAQYEGTRLGRQELYGELLDDVPGALWTWDMIDAHRVVEEPDLDRIVVGIDPAVTNNASSDETGIIVVGIQGRGNDSHFYVLDDRSGKYSPHDWARAAAAAYHNTGADRIVVERNNGADLVEANLRNLDKLLPIKTVWASKGKTIRAEPIAALYEQGRVHHVGRLGGLEDQMTSWDATDPKIKSPDRVDALVWSCTELMGQRGSRMVYYPS